MKSKCKDRKNCPVNGKCGEVLDSVARKNLHPDLTDIEKAVLGEQIAIIAAFLEVAAGFRKNAMMYAAKDAGYAFGIAGGCQAHARGYEAAADLVARRTGLPPCAKCGNFVCSCVKRLKAKKRTPKKR